MLAWTALEMGKVLLLRGSTQSRDPAKRTLDLEEAAAPSSRNLNELQCPAYVDNCETRMRSAGFLVTAVIGIYVPFKSIMFLLLHYVGKP